MCIRDSANELVEKLSNQDITVQAKKIADEHSNTEEEKSGKEHHSKYDIEGQLSLFQLETEDHSKEMELYEEIKDLDISNMTPMDALNYLFQTQKKMKQSGR